MIARILHIIADFIAPKRCMCCDTYDTWLCATCCAGLVMRADQVCWHCKKTPTPYGNLCTYCRGASPLRSIFVATSHTGEQKRLLSHLIHSYKYHFIAELSEPLGTILSHNISQAPLPIPDMIIPVPLHPRRLRWRGFNQSELLARAVPHRLAHHLSIPIKNNLLARTRYTRPQVTATQRTKRINNLRNAFVLINEKAVKRKRILLVDDVATTGATLTECAHTLKQAGAASIDAIVLSRG